MLFAKIFRALAVARQLLDVQSRGVPPSAAIYDAAVGAGTSLTSSAASTELFLDAIRTIARVRMLGR